MKRLLTALVVFNIALLSHSSPKAQVSKQVYFAPYDTVTINGEQRFRARCFGMGGAAAVDLRPDPSTASGVALCASDALPASMAGVLQITNALDGTISPAIKGLMRAALGVANVNELTATTFDQLVFQLLIDLPKAKPGFWKPLQPSSDGKYHIHLGQEFKQTAWLYPHVSDNGVVAEAQNLMLAAIEPALAWAASFAENWTCADNASLTCTLTWTKFIGTGCAIVSNQASCSGTGSTSIRADADTSTADQIAQYTLVSLTRGTSSDVQMSIIVRKDSSATATYYACESFIDNTPTLQHFLYKRVAGSRTDLVTDPTDPANGDAIKLTANGSVMSCEINGATVLGPSTDTSITGNTRAGIRYNGGGASAAAVVDAFLLQDANSGRTGRRAIFFN